LLQAIQSAPNSPDSYLVNEHAKLPNSSNKIPIDLSPFERVKK